jgi:hypothetical protein
MTAATPDLRLRHLARPKLSSRIPAMAPPPDGSGDRIFVTLLSLNFMLLAFFVVMGTTASFDQPHARAVAQNIRVVFAGDQDDEEVTKAHLSARQALQAGVSEALSAVLPALRRFSIDNSDRVDVDVPLSLFAEPSAAADRESTYDGIASLLQSAPPGYRYALLIRGGSTQPGANAASFDFATALVARGVAPRDLLVASSDDERPHQKDTHDGRLSLSFMVFEGDGEIEPRGTRALQAAPPSVSPSAAPSAAPPVGSRP